ncbi:hypothetical protein EDC94DRAFT_699702 [Helicostylum pulchrum]|nr:hypothetical protein EDC94DRAFT_699702 [Helicostylum pulchrum]
MHTIAFLSVQKDMAPHKATVRHKLAAEDNRPRNTSRLRNTRYATFFVPYHKVINMPHLLLDLFTWHNRSNYDSGVEIYIKLKTERGSRYYYCNRYGLIQVDESRYILSKRDARFDINCKDIKEFKIIKDYGGHHYSWIF